MKFFEKIKIFAISFLGVGILCIPNFKNENKNVFAESINNDYLSSLDSHLDVNNGTIHLLYSSGSVGENNGTIENADGPVSINNVGGSIGELRGNCAQNLGTITRCINSTVGTNSGTIMTIDSGAVCTVNERDRNIYTNCGTVKYNNGVVRENYGIIEDCCGGVVSENKQQGIIKFTSSSSNGTIVRVNDGNVFFNDSTKQIEVTKNNGTITINGGSVQIVNNYGTVKIEGKTNLYITNNFGAVEKIDGIDNYNCDCINNYGTISFAVNSNGITLSATNDYESVVFDGDDGKAIVVSCAATLDGVCYTSNAGKLQFTLPDGYYCDDEGAIRDAENPNLWTIETRTFIDETEYKVICHKCHSDDIKKDSDYHWFECDECGSVIGKEEHIGDFVSNNDLNCIADETKTRVCSVCGAEETITVLDSHLNSDKHNPVIDSRVEPTYENTGLTEGSHCADCGKILTKQNEIPSLLDGYVRIVFNGLEEVPTIASEHIACDLGIFIKNNSTVSLVLDKKYACTNTGATCSENNTWSVQVKESDTEEYFTIECHKCAFSKESFNADSHWFECIICGRKKVESAVAHTFLDFVSNKDALCNQDGTKTRTCVNCQYSETVPDIGSSKLVEHSNVAIDARVEPTYENTGLTEGSHCLTCGLVIVAQQTIPKLENAPENSDGKTGLIITLAVGIPVAAGVACGFFFFRRRQIKKAK